MVNTMEGTSSPVIPEDVLEHISREPSSVQMGDEQQQPAVVIPDDVSSLIGEPPTADTDKPAAKDKEQSIAIPDDVLQHISKTEEPSYTPNIADDQKQAEFSQDSMAEQFALENSPGARRFIQGAKAYEALATNHDEIVAMKGQEGFEKVARSEAEHALDAAKAMDAVLGNSVVKAATRVSQIDNEVISALAVDPVYRKISAAVGHDLAYLNNLKNEGIPTYYSDYWSDAVKTARKNIGTLQNQGVDRLADLGFLMLNIGGGLFLDNLSPAAWVRIAGTGGASLAVDIARIGKKVHGAEKWADIVSTLDKAQDILQNSKSTAEDIKTVTAAVKSYEEVAKDAKKLITVQYPFTNKEAFSIQGKPVLNAIDKVAKTYASSKLAEYARKMLSWKVSPHKPGGEELNTMTNAYANEIRYMTSRDRNVFKEINTMEQGIKDPKSSVLESYEMPSKGITIGQESSDYLAKVNSEIKAFDEELKAARPYGYKLYQKRIEVDIPWFDEATKGMSAEEAQRFMHDAIEKAMVSPEEMQKFADKIKIPLKDLVMDITHDEFKIYQKRRVQNWLPHEYTPEAKELLGKIDSIPMSAAPGEKGTRQYGVYKRRHSDLTISEANELAKNGTHPDYMGVVFKDGLFREDMANVLFERRIQNRRHLIDMKHENKLQTFGFDDAMEARANGVKEVLPVRFKNGTTKYYEKEVAQKINSQIERTNLPTYMQNILFKGFNRIVSVDKMNMLLSGKYHVDLFADGVYRNYMADVDTMSHVDAMSVLHGNKDFVEIGKKKYDRLALMDEMAKAGVISGVSFASDFTRVYELSTLAKKNSRYNPLSSDCIPYVFNNKIAEFHQDTIRASMYIDALKKGYNKEIASRMVKTYHFDPLLNSGFVSLMRGTLVPFITEKANVFMEYPKLMIQKPAALGMPARLATAISYSLGNDRVSQEKYRKASREDIKMANTIFFGFSDAKNMLSMNIATPMDMFNFSWGDASAEQRGSIARQFGLAGRLANIFFTKTDSNGIPLSMMNEAANFSYENMGIKMSQLLGAANPSASTFARIYNNVLDSEGARDHLYSSSMSSMVYFAGTGQRAKTPQSQVKNRDILRPATPIEDSIWLGLARMATGGLIQMQGLQHNLINIAVPQLEKQINDMYASYENKVSAAVAADMSKVGGEKHLEELESSGRIDYIQLRTLQKAQEISAAVDLYNDINTIAGDLDFYAPTLLAIERPNEFIKATDALNEMLKAAANTRKKESQSGKEK